MDTAKAIAMIKEGLAILEAQESGDQDEPMEMNGEQDMSQFTSPAAERFKSGKSARTTRAEGVKRGRAMQVEE